MVWILASAMYQIPKRVFGLERPRSPLALLNPLFANPEEAIVRGDFSPYTSPPIPSFPNLTPPVILIPPVINPTPPINSTSGNGEEIPPIDQPSALPPDVSSPTAEEEPSALPPDVSSPTAEEEPSALPPDVSSPTAEEEPSDLPPDVSSPTAEEELSDLPPDVTPEIEAEDNSDLEPDVTPEIEAEDNSDLEPDVTPEIEAEDNSDLEPDVTPEIEAEDDLDLEPDVTPEIEAEDDLDLEPDVTPEIEIEAEDDLDLEPDVTPEIEDNQEDEPISDETPLEDEAGDDSSGELEDDPIEENGGDESSGEDSETGVTVSYLDAPSGIIADLSEGVVTRLFTTSEEVPFKILPLGDSNTRGFPNNAALGGYRTRLWERLVADNGFNINFVGQATSGPEHIDRNHEGRGGFTIDHLIDNSSNFEGFNQPKAPLYTTIEDALNYAQPDAVLLMAGTNDILQGKPVETALTDLENLVGRIVNTMPDTQVLVSSIIPNSSNENRQQRTTEFSEQVEEIVVAPRANTHPNIRFVDLFNLPFVAADYDDDGIHLSASGYDKLADEWYAQIRMLPSGEETLTDVQHLIGSAYDDTLIGDDQANIIRGGEGNDWLIGGAGEDTFILAPGEGTNTIADFESGSDRIGLADGLEFEQLVISPGSDGTQTQIAIADTGESLAILLGIDDTMINADDFILV